MHQLQRRTFLQTTFATTAAFALPAISHGAPMQRLLKIGLIADVHKDIMPDADERLTAFVAEMKRQGVDAIMQLGDFCQPKAENRKFADIFQGFAGPKYHVLGNHDMDGGHRREQAAAFFGMPARYYSFDLHGFHFVVLDGNDRPAGFQGGYPSHIGAEQVAWLKEDLAKTDRPVFVVSHQSLEIPTCIDSQQQIRAILEAEKLPNGARKVVACLNGHWHVDHAVEINGIPYININSASYFWLGSKYKTERLPPELAKKFPYVSHTAPYKSALFTVLECDPAGGEFRIKGKKSAWLGPSPEELKYRDAQNGDEWVKNRVKPEISKVRKPLPAHKKLATRKGVEPFLPE